MSLNTQILMKNFNEGTLVFMRFVLHGTAQIPVGKAQIQAQNELKQTLIGHQGICRMYRQQLKSRW